ncbi:hypothetical protein SAMN05421780_102483 [Flexibacter flexilis DSM 6793]|uniref:Peptidase M1 membrane alanine aminopeptidase domain-containing protein n=1 Tax=Flexibacter flexilis DSM 6793 TaxID=927664 RepID=A0A1I1G779_9BACT|nr:M1 family metallopeptidase [Flexibacter flexilis]SFC07547.1 hypothetical protein SAMN05421780_102483 [Flexibacter flexilis DSM 6793]
MRKLFTCGLLLCAAHTLWAQTNGDNSKLKQLGTELPTPNTYRAASGAPGHEYWQQKADYQIEATLNDEKQSLKGRETITYTNNSPDVLEYLWLQLDQNINAKGSDAQLTETNKIGDGQQSFGALRFLEQDKFEGGYKIFSVKDNTGKALPYTINKTMMRVDLPRPLRPKSSVSFSVEWSYNINDQPKLGGRSGYEFFPEDGNYVYEIAQFFPRMAVYDDVNGWQHKQFLGRGEFTLPFGDYKVSLTVPADHVVGATGELQNASQVLSAKQLQRLEQAKKATKPVLIVSQDEAVQAEKGKPKGTKTWSFSAKNVRDFAFCSSRKFIWDAMQIDVAGRKVMTMSYYPKEGNPLWGQYSTQVVAHTLKSYSKYSINYPYPVAISVHGPVYGMEYPMICFNGGRPEKDGTYSERLKHAMISVIIHEVGHNFYPMIINSDERQWSWLDEGLNSFVQYLTEQLWERNYKSSRGEPSKIAEYMKSDKSLQAPIMVNSESALQFGNNAYAKPAIGLNILRETVMGRELFDFAFKTYAERWAFKHPQPADFFRTMEDASGVDLDWFWRGWFYTTDHVDIALKSVKWSRINTQNPETENDLTRKEQAAQPKSYATMQNEKLLKSTLTDEKPELKDFYTTYDPLKVTPQDKQKYERYVASLSEDEKATVNSGLNFYTVEFENIGGMIMPLIVRMEFEDGTDSVARIPAEVWKLNDKNISKVFVTKKPVASFTLDPYLETADADLSNNSYPAKLTPTRFQLFKESRRPQPNPMQQEKQGTETKPQDGK